MDNRVKRLLLLVDDRSYIRSNCYQRQLAATLAKNYRVRMMSLREIRYLPIVRLNSYDAVLSVLRLRTLLASLESVAALLRGRPLFIYEQDPWQAFMDDSPFRGAYERIANRVNVASFLVTSLWWREFIAGRGLPVKFVRMGMLPELCDAGPDWDARPIRIGFQGTLHAHRRTFFEQLATMNLQVRFLPSASYERYLDNLHGMQIYIHSEAAPWQVNGKLIPRNALWIKETEVAARGTFAMREYEDESEAYGISELPTIMPFRTIEEVPDIVARIEAMSPRERRDRMVTSAETMRKRNDWMTVVRAIEQ